MKRIGLLFALPGLTLVAGVALVLTHEAPSPQRLFDIAMAAVSVLLMWGVAASTYRRYPQRPLWRLLLAAAVALALQLFSASTDAVFYTLARAARPGVETLLVWIMLAFPTGRLRGWPERALVMAGVAAVLLLWVPGMMFSPRVPLAGPFVTCAPRCGANLLFVADRPEWAEAFLQAFRAVGGGVLIATSLLLLARLLRATRLMRRALAPVLLVSVARTVNLAGFVLTGGFIGTQLVTLWAIPLAIWFGLLRGRLYVARSLQRLVSGLRARPGMGELRAVMAEALEDPSLQLGYWDAGARKWLDSAQREQVIPDPADASRASLVLRDARDRPVAVLVHDVALLEEPMLLEAVVASMHNAIVGNQTELALAGERAHAQAALEQERRRIERDLHDGSQQRLLALRLKLGVAVRLLEQDPRRAVELLTEMDADVEETVRTLRSVSHGLAPPLLTERGLRAALAELARHAGVPVDADLDEVGRCAEQVESAVYYCCAEALQNVTKHAGGGATLLLRRAGEQLRFEVRDSGPGLPAQADTGAGQGLVNMRERMQAVGGSLDVRAAPGGGVCVRGEVACRPAPITRP